MKRSQINPELVLMGIDEFANKQDSIHLYEMQVIDSLEILQNQLTAKTKKDNKSLKAKERINEKIKNERFLFLGIGLLIGAVLTFLLPLRRKSNST